MSDISMSHASSWLYLKIPIKARLLGYVDAQTRRSNALSIPPRKLFVSKSTVLEHARPIMGKDKRCKLFVVDLDEVQKTVC